MFDIKLYDETGERETIRGLSWLQMTTVQSVIARLHFLLGNKQYKHKSNQVADESEIAALRSEIANYETARQEDARRLEQVTAELEAMRELIRESKDLLNVASLQLLEANYSTLPVRIDTFTDKLAAALKGGKG